MLMELRREAVVGSRQGMSIEEKASRVDRVMRWTLTGRASMWRIDRQAVHGALLEEKAAVRELALAVLEHIHELWCCSKDCLAYREERDLIMALWQPDEGEA